MSARSALDSTLIEPTANVTAAIVTYNAADFIERSIRGLLTCPEIQSVRIYDNNSSDSTRDILRSLERNCSRIHVTEGAENVGFAKGNNHLLKTIAEPYTLVINPDVVVSPSAINLRGLTSLLCQDPGVGLVTCALYRDDNTFDHACKRGEPSIQSAMLYFMRKRVPWLVRNRTIYYTADHIHRGQVAPVDACSGAFMLMRTTDLQALNGFDEDFWMYGEDLDLCRRIRQRHQTVLYCGSSFAVHLKGASNGGRRPLPARLAFIESMLLYVRKHSRSRVISALARIASCGLGRMRKASLSR